MEGAVPACCVHILKVIQIDVMVVKIGEGIERRGWCKLAKRRRRRLVSSYVREIFVQIFRQLSLYLAHSRKPSPAR